MPRLPAVHPPHNRPNPVLKPSLRADFPLGKPTPKRPWRVGHFVFLDHLGPPLEGVGAAPSADPKAAPRARIVGQVAVNYNHTNPLNPLFVKVFTPLNEWFS